MCRKVKKTAMNKKIVFTIILLLSIYSMSYAVTDFVEEFDKGADEPLSSDWLVAPTWDGSPYSIKYTGNSQLALSLTCEKEPWSIYTMSRTIGPGDFESIVTISDGQFYDDEGLQIFLFQIWDYRDELSTDPQYGFLIHLLYEKGKYSLDFKCRNGGSEKVIRHVSYFNLKYPVKLRLDWDEVNQSIAAYYGFGGEDPNNLIAIVDDYSIRSKVDRYVAFSLLESLNTGKTTTFFVDKLEVKNVEKDIFADKKEIPLPTNVSGRAGGTEISGQWDFTKFDFTATLGKDMRYVGNSPDSTYFGTTKEIGIPNIDGKDAEVMRFSAYDRTEGLAVYPGIQPNGNGEKVNQYSILMDVLFNSSETNKWAILQTSPENKANDAAELYFSNNKNGVNGIGFGESYNNSTPPIATGKWYRIAITVDLAKKVMYEYVNGKYIGKHENFSDLDGRYALTSTKQGYPFLMFTENKGEDEAPDTGSGYLNSLQVRPYFMRAEEIADLGGPTAEGLSVKGKSFDDILKDDTNNTQMIEPEPVFEKTAPKPIEQIEEPESGIGMKIEKVEKTTPTPKPLSPPPPVNVPKDTLMFYNYSEGMDKAASQDKPKILLFTHPSIEMSNNAKAILLDETISSTVSKYILIEVNAKDEKDVSQKYSIFRVPTIVVLDPQGNTIKSWALSSDDITVNSIKNGLDALN